MNKCYIYSETFRMCMEYDYIKENDRYILTPTVGRQDKHVASAVRFEVQYSLNENEAIIKHFKRKASDYDRQIKHNEKMLKGLREELSIDELMVSYPEMFI